MAFTSTLSRSYRLRLMFIITVCLVLGVWGVYDLTVSIPNQQRDYDRFREVQQRLAELEELGGSGRPLTAGAAR